MFMPGEAVLDYFLGFGQTLPATIHPFKINHVPSYDFGTVTYASLTPGYFQFCAYYLDACHRQTVDWGTRLDPPSNAKVLAAACPP
jgi:hypothetical protein